MPRNTWTVPEFLKDPDQAQALVHELLAAHDAIGQPDPADPLRHLVETRRRQLTTWARELSNGFGDGMLARRRSTGDGAEEFLDSLHADAAEQH